MSTTPLPDNFPPGFLEQYSGNTLIAVGSVCLILTTIFGGLRFLARRIAAADLGFDDYLLPPAWLFNTAQIVSFYISVRHGGVGYHVAAVEKNNPAQLEVFAKTLYASELLYFASIAFSKSSVLCLYLRIFVARPFRITCYILIGILVAISFSSIIAATFQCTPVAFQWDKTIQGGTCFDLEAFYKTCNIPNIATDVVILLLPLPMIRNLQASKIRKFGLMCIFLTASVGIIASCIRSAIFFKHNSLADATWEGVILSAWSIVEPSMYFIAACLPALRPVIAKIAPESLKTKIQTTFLKRTRSSGTDKSHTVHLTGIPSAHAHSGFSKLGCDPLGGPLPQKTFIEHETEPIQTREVPYDVEQGLPQPPPPNAVVVRSVIETTRFGYGDA